MWRSLLRVVSGVLYQGALRDLLIRPAVNRAVVTISAVAMSLMRFDGLNNSPICFPPFTKPKLTQKSIEILINALSQRHQKARPLN